MAYKKGQENVETGWSWVVLASSWLALFTVNFLSAGAGILQVEIIEDLQVGSGVVSVMTSLALGMASILGPISGIVTNLLSVRYAVFLGAALMATGMLCVSFSHSLPLMMFFYSIVTGVGFGICYSPLVIVVSFYFDKHRILANSILFCAPGTAIFSLPYLVRYLLDNTGWRYTFALIGGIILHVFVFASVFFPTETEKKKMLKMCPLKFWRYFYHKCNVSDREQHRSEKNFDCNGDISCKEMYRCQDPLVQFDKVKSISSNGFAQESPLLEFKVLHCSKLLSSQVSVISKDSHSTGTDLHTLGLYAAPRVDGSASKLHVSEECTADMCERRASLASSDNSSQLSQYNQKRFTLGLLTKGTGSTVLVSSIMGSSMLVPVKIEELSTDPGIEKSDLISSLKRVCKSKTLWTLNVNSMLFMSGSGVHAIHFPSFAESKGMTRVQVSEFYMVYGIVIVCGRLFGGLVFNRLKSRLLVLLFVLQLLNGVILGCSPLYVDTAGGLFAMMAGIGLVYGQSYILLTPLLSQILSINDLPIAFGINQLFIGIGYTTAPILAGFAYDAIGTYDIPMMMGGSCTALGALLLLPLLLTNKCKGTSEKHSSQENNEKDKEWEIEVEPK